MAFEASPEVQLGFALSYNTFSLGDLNNDGVLDIYTRSNSGGLVMGHAAQQAVVSKAGLLPVSQTELGCWTPLPIVDLNADGNADVVCGSQALIVQLGTGDGQFSGVLTVSQFGLHPVAWKRPGGTSLVAIATDGTLTNIAVSGSGLVATSLGVTLSYAANLIATDVDGDGLDDLVAYSGNGDVSILRAPSLARSDYTIPPGVPAIARDDHGGIALVVWQGAQGAAIPLASGVPQASVPFTPPGAFGLVADVDGDGTSDLLFVDATPSALWMRGMGGGAFADPAVVSLGGTPIVPTSKGELQVGFGDFDGDGHGDLVFASDANYGLVQVLRSCTGT